VSLTNASYSFGDRAISVSILTLVTAGVLSASQPASKGRQTGSIQQQNKTSRDTPGRTEPQKPVEPTKVTLDGPVTVINQPDPKQEQRDAEQRAQTKFTNSVNLWTLVFAGIAAAGAIGAYRANRRSADAEEEQVRLLKSEIEDARKDAAEQRGHAINALAATKKAAEAAQTTAAALKVIHRQWVSIAEWRIVIDRMPKSPGKWWLSVGITIVNSSPLPLTVIAVRMKINRSRNGASSWHSVEPMGKLYEAIHYVLSEDETSAFLVDKPLRFAIQGWVHFADSFGDIQSQQIGTFCEVSRGIGTHLRGLAGLAKSLAKLEKEWPFRPEDYEILQEHDDADQQ
jgi:hypothetical protein